jgi:hypothetical protein
MKRASEIGKKSKPGKGLRHLVFLTRRGRSWAQTHGQNPVSTAMLELTRRCKVWRPGLGFYALRHTFETIGGECGDQLLCPRIVCENGLDGDGRRGRNDGNLDDCCGWCGRRLGRVLLQLVFELLYAIFERLQLL